MQKICTFLLLFAQIVYFLKWTMKRQMNAEFVPANGTEEIKFLKENQPKARTIFFLPVWVTRAIWKSKIVRQLRFTYVYARTVRWASKIHNAKIMNEDLMVQINEFEPRREWRDCGCYKRTRTVGKKIRVRSQAAWGRWWGVRRASVIHNVLKLEHGVKYCCHIFAVSLCTQASKSL